MTQHLNAPARLRMPSIGDRVRLSDGREGVVIARTLSHDGTLLRALVHRGCLRVWAYGDDIHTMETGR